MAKHIITSIYVNVKSEEKFSEKELNIMRSILLHTTAWSVNEGVYLNPPQTINEDPACIFEVDLVFLKAISIDKGEGVKTFISKRIPSIFRNAKLSEPTIELKEHIVSV